MTESQSGGLVGIIANPMSGKDIRRLIAHGSTFDNNEKINIVRRVLVGLAAAGVERVSYLHDGYAIVARAAGPLDLAMEISPLPVEGRGDAGDSLEAARRLVELGAAVIVTLGGDGTNRVVAKGCGDVPLVAISTGTNNVFPQMIEGTLAGLAAGLVATGVAGNVAGKPRAIRRRPRLDVEVNGELRDLALIDLVTSRRSWIGARAVWEPAAVADVVLSGVVPAAIGMASLGGLLFPESCRGCSGVHIEIGDERATRWVMAPVAPGLMRRVPVANARLVEQGEAIELREMTGTIALDGEREIEIVQPGTSVRVMLRPEGPRVVEIETALAMGAARGVFNRS